jgi:hypothetical protein
MQQSAIDGTEELGAAVRPDKKEGWKVWGTPSQPATVLPGGPAKGQGQFSLTRY